MDKFNILHLSDLHIGNTYIDNMETLVLKIKEGLEKIEGIIDVVVITGDIFHEPPIVKENEMDVIDEDKKGKIINDAVNFFDLLLEIINRKKNQVPLGKEDFLFVPGNHDLYKVRTCDTWNLYDGFLDKFYNNSLPRQYDLKHMNIKPYDAKKVLFLGFDSNIVMEEDNVKVEGYITQEQLDFVENLLKDNNKYSNYYKVAFFHHPCSLFEESQGSNSDGIINNALDFSRKLAQWDVKLILHGHKHYARQSIFRPTVGQKIYMFAADSIGISDLTVHSGNIIEIGDKICLKKIVSDNRDTFNIEKVNLRDDYIEGLLREFILKKDEEECEIFDIVIEMINKLYLSYEQLYLLQYNSGNLFVLKNSIKYKLHITHECSKLSADITKDEWLEIKGILDKCTEISKEIKDDLQSDLMKKRHIAFALLAGFFVDLYNKIYEVSNTKVKGYEFNISNSCYYVYFKLKHNENNSDVYKQIKKIMEDFQERLDDIQNFLYCIKLNIKNIFLELQDDQVNNLRYCNFDASIPQLIQLLTGSNIYYHKYTFVRELIQNSIDAISFREKQDKSRRFNSQIHIFIGCDQDNNKYFKIRDFGTGMRREIIDQYFTTLGRSFYKEYVDRRNIQYNSISNFGIGFLSVFRNCKKIVINTKHFAENVCHELEINDSQGHFTICSKVREDFDIGTEMTCYFREQDVICEEIVSYIRSIMLDIKYGINIKVNGSELLGIDAREIRKKKYNNVIFIPFNEEENGNDGKVIKYNDIVLSHSMELYRHGIFIRPEKDKDRAGVNILSAGILMKNARIVDIFGEKGIDINLQCMKVIMNFPPNWLDIDISREKVNGIREEFIKDVNCFKRDIYEEMQRQMQDASVHEDLTLAFFEELLTLMKLFEVYGEENGESNSLDLNVQFKKGRINFSIGNVNGNEKKIIFNKWKIKIKIKDGEMNQAHKTIINLFYEGLSNDEFSTIMQMARNVDYHKNTRKILQELGFGMEDVEDKYLPIVLAIFLENKSNQFQEKEGVENDLRKLIEETILNNCTVGNVIKGWLFSIDYDDREQTRIVMECDALQNRINKIAPIHYGVLSSIDKYDFIWDHVIWKAFRRYNFFLKDSKEHIRENVDNKYMSLKSKTKDLYVKGALIDGYTIASCYMGALMSSAENMFSWNESEDSLVKYRWILDVGLNILYMWILSEYIDSDEEKYNKICSQGELKFPSENESQERYVKILASQEKKSFDVLCIAELLRWIAMYNK